MRQENTAQEVEDTAHVLGPAVAENFSEISPRPYHRGGWKQSWYSGPSV